MPESSAKNLQEITATARYIFKDDLSVVLQKPLQSAKKDLKKFPSICDPGAEKILLFTGSQPLQALESNGLRALLRLGFGEEKKNYAANYRSAREAAATELPQECEKLIRAHRLLRQHRQEICKRSQPLCEACRVEANCRYFQSTQGRKPRGHVQEQE